MALTKLSDRPLPTISDALPEQRHRAARHVAARSTSAEECAELLAMLGLTAEEGLAAEEGLRPED